MKKLYAFWQAFICMTIHRNLKMIHDSGGEHLIVCKICKKDTNQDTKNNILTFWYFRKPLRHVPILLLMFVVGGLHLLITKQQGSFEHPPEHSSRVLI